MENECNYEELANDAPPKHRHIFNADFAFVAITTVAVYSYMMVYTIVFLA